MHSNHEEVKASARPVLSLRLERGIEAQLLVRSSSHRRLLSVRIRPIGGNLPLVPEQLDRPDHGPHGRLGGETPFSALLSRAE